MKWDKLYFDVWDSSFLTRVDLAFRGIALLFVVPIVIFSFWQRSGVLGTAARGSKICFQASGLLWIVAITLSLGALCDSTRHLSGVGAYQRWMRLSMLAFFFQVQAFALLLMAQLGFAAGFRRIGAGSVGAWVRNVKYWGIALYVGITVLNIARLVAFELHIRNTFPQTYPFDSTNYVYNVPFKAAMGFEFAIGGLFVFISLTIAFLTFWVRPAVYRTIYILLGVAAVLTTICGIWRGVLRGFHGFLYFYEWVLWYETEWLAVSDDIAIAAVAMQMWLPVLAMFLIALALGKSSAPALSKV
jgi:hypothetical protein